MTRSVPNHQIDTNKPHPARVYDYLLGGKDHYRADRELGEKLPEFIPADARQNRAFMHRAVAWTARAGIDQYLDIGTGIPTEPNLHQIVQEIRPNSRVAYADNDPMVLRHAEALLFSAPEGATDYIQADLREPGAILEHARKFLDFDRPVTLSLVAVMHFVLDSEDAYGLVRTLVEPLASGSCLVLSHSCLDDFPEYAAQVTETYGSTISYQSRTQAQIERFFDGLDLVEPGVVPCPEWRKEIPTAEPGLSTIHAGVARVR